MTVQIITNSLVVLADAHNPTLISDYFLLESGIIDNVEQINKSSVIITPALSSLNLKDGTQIQINPGKLIMTSQSGDQVFDRGQKYCSSLSFIKGIAVGINFDVNISQINAEKWFKKFNLTKSSALCLEVKHQYKSCNITSSKISNDLIRAQFNFHYQLPKNTPLGEITIDFKKEWQKNLKLLKTFTKESYQ